MQPSLEPEWSLIKIIILNLANTFPGDLDAHALVICPNHRNIRQEPVYLIFRMKYSAIIVIKTENLLNTVIIGKDRAWVPPRPNIMLPEMGFTKNY